VLVCFENSTNKAVRYELGLDSEEVLVSSDLNAQIIYSNGKPCVQSSSKVTLGAYVELWAIVVAYDADGNILESGESRDKEICKY